MAKLNAAVALTPVNTAVDADMLLAEGRSTGLAWTPLHWARLDSESSQAAVKQLRRDFAVTTRTS